VTVTRRLTFTSRRSRRPGTEGPGRHPEAEGPGGSWCPIGRPHTGLVYSSLAYSRHSRHCCAASPRPSPGRADHDCRPTPNAPSPACTKRPLAGLHQTPPRGPPATAKGTSPASRHREAGTSRRKHPRRNGTCGESGTSRPGNRMRHRRETVKSFIMKGKSGIGQKSFVIMNFPVSRCPAAGQGRGRRSAGRPPAPAHRRRGTFRKSPVPAAS
jgi:hypothetical protein